MFVATGAATTAACGVFDALCCVCSAACCVSRLCKCLKCCGGGGGGGGGGGDGGGGEPSYPHGAGRKGSTWLMILALGLAIFGQFYGYKLLNSDGEGHVYSEDGDGDYFKYWDCGSNKWPTCAQYSATERVSMAASCVFFILAVVGYFFPWSHDYGWDLKFLLFFGALIGFIFCPVEVFDSNGYVWPARVGAYVFLVLQQIILISSAYNLNDMLLDWDEQESGPGGSDETCSRWKALLISLSVGTYAASFTGIVLMFVYFTGCADNDTFISLSVVFICGFTLLQVLDEDGHGNLLTSAVVAGYVTYLTYVSVSSNPNGGEDGCNPLYSESTKEGPIILGLGLVLVSTSVTIYFSSRSIAGLAAGGGAGGDNLSTILTTGKPDAEAGGGDPFGSITAGEHISQVGTGSAEEVAEAGNQVATFNTAMMLIAMYWCMVLTDWGNVHRDEASDSSPTAGRIVMVRSR